MREILFRGKTNCGIWVQGDLIHRQIWSSKFEVIRLDDSGFDNYTEYEVATDTIGQYTGLTDKNGKKIFEGDIVRYKKNCPCKIEYINCQFAMMWENFYRDFEDVYDHDVEVIGNVFDNPELLKGGAK